MVLLPLKKVQFYINRAKIDRTYHFMTGTKIVHKVNTHSKKLLLKLLGAVIPHLGGESLDIVDEVSNIKLLPTSTYNSIFLDISKLMRLLHISRQYVPPTTLRNIYFNLVMKVLAQHVHVTHDYRDFRSHTK